MWTLKAIIDEEGRIELLEPLEPGTKRHVLVTILDPEVAQAARPFGLCKGEFRVPGDFDAPLLEDVLEDFERA